MLQIPYLESLTIIIPAHAINHKSCLIVEFGGKIYLTLLLLIDIKYRPQV